MADLAYEERLLWNDPDPDTRGVLLSDRIQFYAQRVRLINPLNTKNLRPASYNLSLGKQFYKEGKVQQLNNGDILTLPPNDIIFVTTEEVLQIPHYMIGRFNLIFRLVYQGVLLGTGPQVDPGYRGPLYCPLYNLSDQEVQIAQGDRFATIDFMKTTTFAENDRRLASILTEDDLHKTFNREELKGYQNIGLTLFPQEMKKRDLSFHLPRYKVSSSLVELRNKIEQMEGTFRTLQISNYIAIIIVGVVIVTLAILSVASIFYHYTWIMQLSEEIAKLCTMIPGCR